MAHPLVEFEGQLRGRVDQITNAARMREAPPAEVRAELTAFCQGVMPHVLVSGRHFGDDAWTARMTQTLAELPACETAEYARRIGVVLNDNPLPNPAPPAAAPAVKKKSSIFANAKETAKDQPWKANAETYDRSYTFKCVHCGAPQQVELDFKCRFCHETIDK